LGIYGESANKLVKRVIKSKVSEEVRECGIAKKQRKENVELVEEC
jgi:hypothetical protein